MTTQQEIFEIVAKHLFSQGRRAIGPRGDGCAYRTSDGLRCAVGCLISPEDYQSEMEGHGVFGILQMFLFPNSPHMTLTNKELLSKLQAIHDDPFSWKDHQSLKKGLYEIAEDFDLDPSVLQTLTFPKEIQP